MPQRNEKMTDTQKITDKVSQEPEIIDNSKLNNLIINGRKITVDSRTLANIFCREHKSVLSTIDSLIEDRTISQHEFLPREYQNRGKNYRCFELNEAGFLKAMPFLGGRRSREGQKLLVDEFLNKRERLDQLSKERETEAYQLSRTSGKDSRKLLADEINKFVQYAIDRESNNADQYFNLITKVVYNAILVTNPKASKIREQLTTIQLSILSTAELIAAKVLKESMELELPYKEIFKQVKSSLNSIPMSKTEVLGA
jgi:phage regulator Rha-like protein